MLVSCACIHMHPVRASTSSFLSIPSSCKMETTASSSMPSTKIGGSEVAERFTVRKFGESTEAWSDKTNWSEGMLNVLVRAGVHRFLFSQSISTMKRYIMPFLVMMMSPRNCLFLGGGFVWTLICCRV